jgi:PadR family transcriptional regulator PadR
MYGYQIAKVLGDEQSDTTVKQGVLYPALRSLESSGLLSSLVEPSVSGPPRRYYQITDMGREALNRWRQIWGKTVYMLRIYCRKTGTFLLETPGSRRVLE